MKAELLKLREELIEAAENNVQENHLRCALILQKVANDIATIIIENDETITNT